MSSTEISDMVSDHLNSWAPVGIFWVGWSMLPAWASQGWPALLPCCLAALLATQITMAAMNDLLDRPYNLPGHDKSLWWHPPQIPTKPMHSCHQWWRWRSWLFPFTLFETCITQRNNGGVQNLLKLSVKLLSDAFILCHACYCKPKTNNQTSNSRKNPQKQVFKSFGIW